MNTPQQPDNDAAAVLTPREIMNTQENGRRAAVTGSHPSTCPWGQDTAEDKARRTMWIRGYAAGRTELRTAAETGPEATGP